MSSTRALFDRHFTKKRKITAAIIGFAAIASASIFATGPNAKPEELEERAWPVSVRDVAPMSWSPSFIAYGQLEAAGTAELAAEVSGRVAQVFVREGDVVSAGDLLVKLDDEDMLRRVRTLTASSNLARATLQTAQSEFDLARRTVQDYRKVYEVAQGKLNRHEELLERRLISQTLFDEVASDAAQSRIVYERQQRALDDQPNVIARAVAELEKAVVALEQSQADLRDTEVRAPFDGPVLEVITAVGEMAAPSKPLVAMADEQSVELRLQIPDSYVARVHAALASGQDITATMDTGAAYRLARLGRQVRAQQSGIDAFFAPLPGQVVPPIGLVTQARIQLPAEADLLALPPQAIFEGNRIYAVHDARLSAVPVQRVGETLSESEYFVLVKSPVIRDATTVLVTPLPQASEGMLVEAIGPTKAI